MKHLYSFHSLLSFIDIFLNSVCILDLFPSSNICVVFTMFSLWLAFSRLKIILQWTEVNFNQVKSLSTSGLAIFSHFWLLYQPPPSNYSFQAEAPKNRSLFLSKPCYHPVPADELLSTLVSHFLIYPTYSSYSLLQPTCTHTRIITQKYSPPKHSSFYQNVHLFILSTAVWVYKHFKFLVTPQLFPYPLNWILIL